MAGWAALIAKNSLQGAQDLVALEQQARSDRVGSQARRVMAAVTESGSSGTTVQIRNRSADAIFKIFVRVTTVDNSAWFHLREELPAGTLLTGSCDVVSKSPAKAGDVPPWPTLCAWFTDADGRWWELDSRGELAEVAGPPVDYDPATNWSLKQTD